MIKGEMLEEADETMEEREVKDKTKEICMRLPTLSELPVLEFGQRPFQLPHRAPVASCSPGILYVNGSLDYETAPKYFLSIECSKMGISSLSDVTTLVVNITDVNEHRPHFMQDGYHAQVPEDANVGEPVLTVRLTMRLDHA